MRKVLLLTLLALGPTATWAENGLFYLGAGLSYNSVTNITELHDQGDISDGSWKAFVGVHPLNWLAVEADYMDLGNGHTTNTAEANACLDLLGAGLPCTLNANSHGSAYAGYLVGFVPIPLPILDVFAKAGAAHWKLNGDVEQIPGTSFSKSGTDFAWGIGVQGHISMFGARLEYEQFDIPNTSGAKIASLSVFLNF